MKLLQIRFLFIILILSAKSVAQNNKTVLLQTRLDFTWQNTDAFQIKFVVPKEIKNKQKIEQIKYSQQPDTIYEKDGNRYVEFKIEGLNKPNTLEIITLLELYPNDLKNAKKNKTKITIQSSFENYLRSEQYIECDDEIIKEQAIILKKKNDLETVKNIYNFVTQNIKYDGYNPNDVGAKQALLEKKGDCTEYTDLFVALCRACSIPAKHVLGYFTGPVNTPKHSWAEVFFNNWGWVQFEVTPGNGASFEDITRRYIYLTDVRTDKNLNNKYFYYYRYWGEEPTIKETISVKEYQKHSQNAKK